MHKRQTRMLEIDFTSTVVRPRYEGVIMGRTDAVMNGETKDEEIHLDGLYTVYEQTSF
jgi:hypothetical protein